jgi:subtilase family serine protease
VGSLRLSGDTVSFQVANIGANTVAPVSLRGVAGNATLFQSQLASLGPGQARELTVTPSWPDAGRQLRVEVDWANEVRESREDNNVAAL